MTKENLSLTLELTEFVYTLSVKASRLSAIFWYFFKLKINKKNLLKNLGHSNCSENVQSFTIYFFYKSFNQVLNDKMIFFKSFTYLKFLQIQVLLVLKICTNSVYSLDS
jgi:hypothetical protein